MYRIMATKDLKNQWELQKEERDRNFKVLFYNQINSQKPDFD
jgi:hypothetical protein